MSEAGMELVEGIDYYAEDGRWVFTAAYHLKRCRCCKNGCRHCPYGKPPADRAGTGAVVPPAPERKPP